MTESELWTVSLPDPWAFDGIILASLDSEMTLCVVLKNKITNERYAGANGFLFFQEKLSGKGTKKFYPLRRHRAIKKDGSLFEIVDRHDVNKRLKKNTNIYVP